MPKDKFSKGDQAIVKKAAAGVDNTFRRTWDKEEFAEKAAKREKQVGTATQPDTERQRRQASVPCAVV